MTRSTPDRSPSSFLSFTTAPTTGGNVSGEYVGSPRPQSGSPPSMSTSGRCHSLHPSCVSSFSHESSPEGYSSVTDVGPS